jgi:hypothetical protein
MGHPHHTGNRGVNDPGGARDAFIAPSRGLHATVPSPSPSEPQPGRHRTPPRRSRGTTCKSLSVWALLELYKLGSPRAFVVHVCGAGDRWGLRTCKASVPPRGPFLNPLRGRTTAHQGVRRLLNRDGVIDIQGRIADLQRAPVRDEIPGRVEGFLDASEPTSGCQIARFVGAIDSAQITTEARRAGWVAGRSPAPLGTPLKTARRALWHA